jgi:hypothetical protein
MLQACHGRVSCCVHYRGMTWHSMFALHTDGQLKTWLPLQQLSVRQDLFWVPELHWQDTTV